MPLRCSLVIGRWSRCGYRSPVDSDASDGAAGTTAASFDPTGLTGVMEAVQGARSALAALHHHPANHRGWPRTAAAASVRAARASAVMEGGNAALDPDVETVRDPVLAGALRAAASIGSMCTVWERSPLQALARLHALAAADLVQDQSLLGRPVRAADRLSALARLVIHPPWPAPVLAAVVHAELLTQQPFGVADGVIARAAARLVAITSGLDPHGLGVPEVAQMRAGRQYRQLAAGFASGSDEGIQRWIIASCQWLAAGAREGNSIAEAAG